MENDKELEALRRKKMQELKAYIEQQQYASQRQEKIIEDQIHEIMRRVMTPEARERLARVKMVRPELAALVEQQILMLIQAGRLRSVIDDDALRLLLDRLSSEKREIRIRRR